MACDTCCPRLRSSPVHGDYVGHADHSIDIEDHFSRAYQLVVDKIHAQFAEIVFVTDEALQEIREELEAARNAEAKGSQVEQLLVRTPLRVRLCVRVRQQRKELLG